METLLTVVFGILVFGASFCLLSMEYYAHRSRMVAASSVPWMRKAVIKRLNKEVKEMALGAPLILDLGSGWGTLALAAAKACSGATVVGYEISPVPLAFSRLKAWLWGYKHVKFLNVDMFTEDFSKADIVLAYLAMPHMERLRSKFEAELKPGAVVICNTFPVPGWTPACEETVQDFIYKLKVYTFRV
ncbi:MAG TPA: class I SAM-dependent methyltransferase [Micavibrio sp.]|nr:class I SAM-dependent methyltransferase [Micavibrio sp.]